MWTRVAIGAVQAVSSVPAAHGQGRGAQSPRYKPAATEDTDVLLVEPCVMAPRTLRLSTAPDTGLLPERAYCEVYETGKIFSQIRH